LIESRTLAWFLADAACIAQSNESLFMRLSEGSSRAYLLFDQCFSHHGEKRF
jgi:hypothetical protein